MALREGLKSISASSMRCLSQVLLIKSLNAPGKFCKVYIALLEICAKLKAASYSDRLGCPGNKNKFAFLGNAGHSMPEIRYGLLSKATFTPSLRLLFFVLSSI